MIGAYTFSWENAIFLYSIRCSLVDIPIFLSMSSIRRFFAVYLPTPVIQRLVTFFILAFLAFVIRDFLVLFFITFIFAYIFLELGKTLSEKIHTW